MVKKGFTLIELLAVILILGIIALIAIPQVTNVIENASKGAAETSAEHYIVAINDKIVLTKLDTDSSNDIRDGVIEINSVSVDMTGEKPTDGKIVVLNGNVIRAELTVNNHIVACDEKGKCEIIDKYLYSINYMSTDTIDNTLTTPPTDTAYIKYSVVNNKLTRPQVCFIDDNNEFCLYENDFEISQRIIYEYFGYDKSTWQHTSGNQWRNSNNSIYCNISDNNIGCYKNSTVGASVYKSGPSFAYKGGNDFHCTALQNTATCTHD